MDNITATPFGAAEHCALDNWAAEYAKKLFITEAAKRTEEINAEAQTRAAADTEEAQARAAADTEEARARAAADTEEAQARAAADAALDNKKVNRNEYETAVNKLNEKIDKKVTMDIYSTSPQRIGTWIDGTPIWRIAFQREITEEERTNKTVYIDLPVTDNVSVYVINAWGQLMAYTPCAVDDEPIRYANGITFTSELIANTAFTGVYGWIEFAAPVNIIKNPSADSGENGSGGSDIVFPDPGEDEGGEQIGDEASGENG